MVCFKDRILSLSAFSFQGRKLAAAVFKRDEWQPTKAYRALLGVGIGEGPALCRRASLAGESSSQVG